MVEGQSKNIIDTLLPNGWTEVKRMKMNGHSIIVMKMEVKDLSFVTDDYPYPSAFMAGPHIMYQAKMMSLSPGVEPSLVVLNAQNDADAIEEAKKSIPQR